MRREEEQEKHDRWLYMLCCLVNVGTQHRGDKEHTRGAREHTRGGNGQGTHKRTKKKEQPILMIGNKRKKDDMFT